MRPYLHKQHTYTHVSNWIFENVTAKWTFWRPTIFFRAKTIFKVAIMKTKRATIAFFSSTPFFLLALSFSSFLSHR